MHGNVCIIDAQSDNSPQSTKVKVEFYGESMCPFCRKFVAEAWPAVWRNEDLKEFVDYTMVPWGNAYFTTQACGGAPYNAQTRACWYKNCVETSADDPDCFEGEIVYQHGPDEGILDIYESCVLNELGITVGVEFAECVEGSNMEKYKHDVPALVEECLSCRKCRNTVDACVHSQRGKDLEIQMAKKTPSHPGVPYIVVNGKAIDNPLAVKQAVCETLSEQDRPESCGSSSSGGASGAFIRSSNSETVNTSMCV